jgi:hypothetical protein
MVYKIRGFFFRVGVGVRIVERNKNLWIIWFSTHEVIQEDGSRVSGKMCHELFC